MECKWHAQYLVKASSMSKLPAGHKLYVIAEATGGSRPVDIMSVTLVKPLTYAMVRFAHTFEACSCEDTNACFHFSIESVSRGHDHEVMMF
jgi:hypothetical protein